VQPGRFNGWIIVIYKIRVIPKAKENKVAPGDPIKIYTTAVPADGKANESVIKLLSDYFDIAKSKIKIIRGETTRDKIIEITES
jgi:uncharacterized protein (TIGR00251 family)